MQSIALTHDVAAQIRGSQISRAAEALARAFQSDPMMTYITPDDTRRASVLSWFFNTGIRYGQSYGEVYTTEPADGTAIWLSPGNTTMTLWRMLRTGMLAAPLKFGLAGFGRFMNIMDYAEKAHKQAAPGLHWYLLGLGVEPSRQGQGLGGALIQPILARADTEGLPCYLETVNEKNLPFYQKHGFKVAVEGQVPRGGPYLWAMVRAPRP